MALQSAISSTPLEKFSTEGEISDEDRFILRLSDGEDEDDKGDSDKTDNNITTNLTAEAEEEILNKFDSGDSEVNSAVDESEQNQASKQNNKTEEAVSNENAPEGATKKEQEEKIVDKTDEAEASAVVLENGIEDMNVEKSQDTSTDNSNSVKLRDLESVTKDLKDTVDTEDLLQLTSVKEADAANETSSSSSSEKDDSEEAAEQSVDDIVERDDENDDLIDRHESMDCGDMMDIEENNSLGVEVSEEMNKDYENLLNSEKKNELSKNLENDNTEKANNIEKIEKSDESNNKSDTLICNGDASTLEKDALNDKVGSDDKLCVSGAQEKDVGNTNITSDKTIESYESNLQNKHQDEQKEQNVPASVKRSLSECETEKGSKKIRLTESQVPFEQKIVILQTLTDFMKSKSLKKLSRRNLEEFCIQKICEVLIHKSEIGELRHQLQSQEQMMEFWKKETTAMAKQVKDLEIVNKKMLNELKLRQETDTPPVPVKITRSVGLQVKLESIASKRMSRGGSEMLQTPVRPVAKSFTNNKAVSSQVIRQNNKETLVPSVLSTTLLSQTLAKETQPLNSTGNNTGGSKNSNSISTTPTSTTKGVIDLTDEDDKTSSLSSSNNNSTISLQSAKATTVRASTGIAIVTSKPTTTGAATSNTPKLMYVLQPSPQLSQTSDLSKPGGTKTFMFRLQNGVIGSPNGIFPNIPNGSQITSLPQSTLRAGQVRLQSPVSPSNVMRTRSVDRHPAPLPPPPPPPPSSVVANSRKPIPPKPQLSIRKSGQGIVLSWKLPHSVDNYEIIASYQLYAYQKTNSPPNSDMWRKVGDVKALALPMACTLTQFADGNKYYFAVRAVDVLKRIGPFSDPEPISL